MEKKVKEQEKKPQKRKISALIALFWAFFKIGLFTFGGGYAMIALIENEFTEKKKWIDHDEFMDVVAIAESTPGPIAINCATYIGYKVWSVIGSVVATIAVCIPSFAIIFIISLFFDAFLEIQAVANAFRGIQACVVFLILSAGIKMFVKMKKNAANLVLFSATFVCMVTFSLLSIAFSSVFYILAGGATGVVIYLVGRCAANKKAVEGKNPTDNGEDKRS